MFRLLLSDPPAVEIFVRIIVAGKEQEIPMDVQADLDNFGCDERISRLDWITCGKTVIYHCKLFRYMDISISAHR